MKRFLKKVSYLLFLLILGCSTVEEKSAYQKLQSYDGRYTYINNTELELVTSALDTVLYAIIDGAKYPLTYIEADSFVNIQNEAVVFIRNEQDLVIGYQAGGITFKLLSRDIGKTEMLPRKALFNNPDGYAYAAPQSKADGIETGSLAEAIEDAGKITEMVKATIRGTFPEVHSILIYKANKLVLEEYFYGYDENTMHQLRSAGKALKGGILGIAIDHGFIASEAEKLLPFFDSIYPDIAHMDERKAQITIADFLHYQHGMDCMNNNPESAGYEQRMMQSADWVKHTLDLPMLEEPGKTTAYCTGCSLTINRLIELATQQKIETFAKQHLFEPMGISNYKWTFEPNPTSINTFNQLYMTPRDLLKLAIMYKDSGQWNGQQIISKDWIAKTFNMQEGGYGFFWENKSYIVDGQRYDSFLATGNGGQKINIWPDLDMITIFTGGNYNSYAIYGKSTPPNEMIPNYILKAIKTKE